MSSNHGELQELLHRVGRLERQNRRMKLLGAAVLISGAAALVMAADKAEDRAPEPAQARVIEARQFRVVDSQGRERISLGMGGEGPVVRLYDEGGKPRVGLGMTSEGSTIGLHDRAGDLGISMSVNRSGPGMVLSEGERTRVVVAASRDSTGINMNDAGGKPIAALIDSPKGTMLTLGNARAAGTTPLIALQAKGEKPTITLYESGKDRPVWQAP